MSEVDSKTPDDEAGDGTRTPEKGITDRPPETEANAELSPLEEALAERDKLKDQLLRTAADFDNFRKRTRKDLDQAERRGKEEVLRELLPVFDNLERAMKAGESKGADISGIMEGIEMVLRLFDDTAQRIGLTRIEAVGQRFDPAVHDAFQQVETNEQPPGTIVAEYQTGYRLGDKLLRPAMVVVARKRSEPEGDGG